MNKHLQKIMDFLQQNDQLSAEEKNAALKSLKDADKELEITSFKLDRTEKVKRTTAILLEETIDELEQKRKAVEAQNRELEVEGALERIRAIAMSMGKPDDLLSISETMFNELKKLGFSDLRNAMINIHYDEKNYLLNYDFAENTGRTVTTFTYNSHPIVDNIIQHANNSRDSFTEMIYSGKSLDNLRAFRKQNGESDDTRLDNIDALYYYFYSTGTGAVGISMFNPANSEQLNILKRFRNVFDLAYRRYTDIVNAEAQARESQIQLALERVRARTMAMQHSSEMADASFVLDTQVRALGINTRGCAFNIYGEGESTEWFSSADGSLPMYKTPRENLFLRYYETGQRGEKIYIEEFAGEVCKKHYEYLCTIPIMGDALRGMIAAGGSFPTRQIDHVVYFKYGYLLFLTLEPVPEAHEIFIRFAKVFEQTYTRFLDLQKAEAQAREAQVEIALEKVRSRTMAMQHSDDLLDAATLLFSQIEMLGAPAWNCSFNIWSEDKKYATAWNGTKDGFGRPFQSKSSEDVFLDFYTAAQRGDELYVKEIGGKELEHHYEYLATVPGVGATLAELKEAGIKLPTFQVFNIAYFAHGYLMFITYESVPEFADIFKRFAKVFEQTYTRFLDLQKAEAQSRESQIQLALERVRARTMAMQKSAELSETAVVLFHQLMSLDLNVKGCGFNIWEKNEKTCTSWMSGPDGELSAPFILPLATDPLFIRYYESRQKGEDFWVYETNKEELLNRYKYLSTLPILGEKISKELKAGKEIPSFVVDHVVNFSHGNLIFIANEHCPDDWDIFKRFGKVFEQTYTRFLDLQKAEAQVREAQIEAALERVRSRTMGMQKSEELKEVIQIVYEQFVHLNINTSHAGFVMDYQTRDDYSIWIADRFGTPAQITIPYFDSIYYNRFNKAKEEGDDFFSTILSLEEKNKFYNDLFPHLPDFPEASKEIILSEPGFTISTALLNNVALYIENFTGVPYTDEENAILIRFGKVFQQTYTRFLDLQKAEAQSKEAQIEAALERVRSRTLAMQKSDELAETAAVLFQQLIALGIEPNRLYITIVKNDEGDTEFWITDEDGTKISTAFSANMNDNPTFAKMFDGWKQQKKSLMIDTQGEDLTAYFQHLSSIGVPFKEGLTQKRRVQDIAYFSHGFIGIASPDDQPIETLQLLERFAAVFNLTFTRFNDLKVAEAHAVQAELDLIEIKAAKQKAEDTLTELKAAQRQLVQSEKMASLGELTAGIAHEIQNPLNFVNNFSELSNELIAEMKEELAAGNQQLAGEIIEDIVQNLEKINHHGKRAEAIVKGMLQHSRQSTGKKEPTDINALCDEYLRLAYHGLRAKDNSFNATLKTGFDQTIGSVNVIPQDIGRVTMNLLTNAFYAVNEKKKSCIENYESTVSLSTRKKEDSIEIIVADNGNGIPKNIVDKIFQPFFTTKPTGQGTGLGLSLAYDIIMAHEGDIKVDSKEGEGTTFSISLPVNK